MVKIRRSATTALLPPTRSASENDQAVETGTLVTLDATSSHDPDGTDPLVYDWTIVQKPVGSAALLSDGASPTPNFTVDAAGNYLAELVVTDSLNAASAPDSVMITAYSRPTAGGSATAMTVTKVVCVNVSTGKRVKLLDQGPDSSWDCEAAGLLVNPGDSIRMNVFGQAG